MFNKLIDQTSSMISIVKSLHLISGNLYILIIYHLLSLFKWFVFFTLGIYDVYEAQSLKVVNPNNILALNENNVLSLSPILFDFNKWIAAVKHASVAPTAIHLYVGSNDAPKLIGQAHCLINLLNYYQYPNFDLISLQNIDHFDIVEKMAQSNFSITKRIIAEAFSNWIISY